MIPSLPVAFLDTETLGLDPVLNPIWEVAAIVDDVEHVWTIELRRDLPWRRAGDPPLSVPHVDEGAADINGFRTRYHPDRAQPAHQVFAELAALLKGRCIVGAVPSFDDERLRRMMATCALPEGVERPRSTWDYHLIDIRSVAIGWLAAYGALEPVPRSLGSVGRAVGLGPVPPEERHTALGDARYTKAIWEAVV